MMNHNRLLLANINTNRRSTEMCFNAFWISLVFILAIAFCIACGDSDERATPDSRVAGSSGLDGSVSSGNAGWSEGGATAGSGGGSGGQISTSGGGGATSDAGGIDANRVDASGVDASSDVSGEGGNNVDFTNCPRPTNHTPGSRLRPYYIVTEEGGRIWHSWYDSEREEECGFMADSNGQIVCVPEIDVTNEYFLDAECTDAVYAITSFVLNEPRRYIMTAVEIQSPSCFAPPFYPIYERGEAVTPEQDVYIKIDDSCEARDLVFETFYRRGPEIPSSAFVQATHRDAAQAGRVITAGFHATDGAIQVRTWKDTQLNAYCIWMPDHNGIWRCSPTSSPLDDYYSDPTCSNPLFRLTTYCEDQPAVPYVADTLQVGCSYRAHRTINAVFSVGAQFTETVYRDQNGCAEWVETEQGEFYQITEQPLDILSTAQLVVDESEPGRIKTRYLMTPDGSCWLYDRWDSELETHCEWVIDERGMYRCIPNRSYDIWYTFTDDGCTQPAAFLAFDDCQSTDLPPYFVGSVVRDSNRKLEIWQADGTINASDMPPLWEKPSDSCYRVTPNKDQYLKLIPADPSVLDALVKGEAKVE